MGNKTFIKVYTAPPGIIAVKFTKEHVIGVRLLNLDNCHNSRGTKFPPKTNFLDLFERYLSGEVVELSFVPVRYGNLPEDYIRVYEYMRRYLGYGKTMTYGDLGRVFNIHPRTVGMMLSKNPLPILVPCHRILAKSGLGGYSAGLKWKRFLLALEGSLKDRGTPK